MTDEAFKPVVGYEGLYEVSSFGRVLSASRVVEVCNASDGRSYKKRIHGRFLKQWVSKAQYGRKSVKLSKDGVSKTHLVSHLVAAAFIGPRPDGYEVAHNNGDAGDNMVENLRYALPKENTHDKFKHGTVLRGSDVGTSKLTEDDIREIRNLAGNIIYDEIADIFGISICQVSRIVNRTRWGHVV